MRIAVITQGDPNNRAGFFNNVHERILHLVKKEDVHVDVFILQYAKRIERNSPTKLLIDGIDYHIFYVKITALRYLASFKMKIIPYPGYIAVRKYVSLFKDYDLLSVHSIGAMQIAETVKEKYGVPYVVTWHGSDVHTNPHRNPKLMKLTRKVMSNADMNFFVSNALLKASDVICQTNNKEVLYSGVSKYFKEYDDDKKKVLRKQYEIETKKVVAFLGNIISIKNVLSLPMIFNNVAQSYGSTNLKFWIIGDGNLYGQLQSELEKTHIDYRMFGMQKPDVVPDLLNCVDVLVLPSFNEGLPLVTEEALQCGVNVVGSNVGGIAEVIGDENVFDLDDDFVVKIAEKICSILKAGVKPKPLSDKFGWDACTLHELECYHSIINPMHYA